MNVFKLLAISFVALVLSCSNSTNVAGGFGSETSTGVVLMFEPYTHDSGDVICEFYAIETAETVMPAPVKRDTADISDSTKISLSAGTYRMIAYHRSSNTSTTSLVTVPKSGVASLTGKLTPSGTITIRFADTLRTAGISLALASTPFAKSANQATKNGAFRELILADVPAGLYQSLLIVDTQLGSSVTAVPLVDSVISGDTTVITLDPSLWPDQLPTNGMITVNWNAPSDADLSGDTLVTRLFSAGSSGELAAPEQKKIGMIGAVTFLAVTYGTYNVVCETRPSGYTDTIAVTVNSNSNVVVQGTLTKSK